MASWLSARQWLFSLKVYAAAMLALYIALALALPRPYWAMATVYLVSNPVTGATRAKAAYRVVGTLLGATAAVVTVPLLVNAPVLLMGAISLWSGALLYLSLLDRAPRNYIFLLSAYTLPIVALPAVSQPVEIFDLAIARVEEIAIGIVCAGMVSALFFPTKVAPTLRDRAAVWLGDAGQWAAEILSAAPDSNAFSHENRHRLVSDISTIDQLIKQLSYDTEGTESLRNARALWERMAMLLPLLSSLAGVVRALRSQLAGIPEDLARHMTEMSRWIRGGFYGPAPTQIPPATPPAANGMAPGWHASLVATANELLLALAALGEDCRALQRSIGDRTTGSSESPLRVRGLSADRASHHDHGMLLFYACSTSLAVFCAGLLWIVSQWEAGAGAVVLAAVTSCFFATIEEPRSAAHSFLRWSGVCFAVSAFYLFAVVPYAHDFVTLAGMLAVPYLGIGLLLPRPGFNLIALLLSLNTASFANFQSVFDANFLATINGSLASIGGMLFAPLWAMATRPFGARVAARRLIRASWKDLAQAATCSEAPKVAKLGGRMVDRLNQLAPRLTASVGNMPSDGFAELQIGFSLLALRRGLSAMRPQARRAVTGVLNAVASHFRARLGTGTGSASPATLRACIEKAIGELAAFPGDGTRHALAALVVLRLTLYPIGKESQEVSP
ncbi:FUSC family protein [Cupriavidus sp. 2MCAB6]|uniref:FUSC family protein n=1 Tax=Cupriavidus sp. 2MCAB6 TaxID=3232981 RepID=UPI003F8F2957